MNYEQKYKEALEKARLLKLANPDDEAIQTFVKDSFPELKKSEDERIRKVLVSIVKWLGFDSLFFTDNSVTKSEVLAYLEKQKEQKPISAEGVLIRAGLKPYKDGNQWCILAGDNIQEGVCGFGDTIEDALYEFLIEVLDLQKKQKPAEWSEKDKRKLNRIYEILGYAADDKGFLTSKRIIGDNEAIELQDFLKSLRPSWKPSEEQMEELNKVRTLNPGLDALYQQLKNM